jgi:hypothetical protein
MVVIKTSGNIKDIKGSIGENIFSSNKGTCYIRSKGKTHSNPQSQRQSEHRSSVSTFSKIWNDTLTQSQRNSWEQYARDKESGFNAFMRLNIDYKEFTPGGAVAISHAGNDPIDRAIDLTFATAEFDLANPAPAAGIITKFSLWLRTGGHVKFKIFRDGGATWIFVSETEYINLSAGANIDIVPVAQMPILPGDMIGWYSNDGAHGTGDNILNSMGFKDGWMDVTSTLPKADWSILPYLVSVQATIESGTPTKPYIPDAPIGITAPDAPIGLTATYNVGTHAIDVTWTPGTVPGSRIGIWLQGQNIPIHKQLAASEDITLLSKSISQVKGAKGVSLNLSALKGMFDIWACACDDYGQLSPLTTLLTGIKVT